MRIAPFPLNTHQGLIKALLVSNVPNDPRPSLINVNHDEIPMAELQELIGAEVTVPPGRGRNLVTLSRQDDGIGYSIGPDVSDSHLVKIDKGDLKAGLSNPQLKYVIVTRHSTDEESTSGGVSEIYCLRKNHGLIEVISAYIESKARVEVTPRKHVRRKLVVKSLIGQEGFNSAPLVQNAPSTLTSETVTSQAARTRTNQPARQVKDDTSGRLDEALQSLAIQNQEVSNFARGVLGIGSLSGRKTGRIVRIKPSISTDDLQQELPVAKVPITSRKITRQTQEEKADAPVPEKVKPKTKGPKLIEYTKEEADSLKECLRRGDLSKLIFKKYDIPRIDFRDGDILDLVILAKGDKSWSFMPAFWLGLNPKIRAYIKEHIGEHGEWIEENKRYRSFAKGYFK